MKVRRVFRANKKTPAERSREKALRDKLQRERPSLDDLLEAGECDSDAVMTMGMYFDIQRALQGLKKERLRRSLSIADISRRSGIDRAVISRLENGKQDNPTVATLMRYAAAIGKRFVWGVENSGASGGNGTVRNGKAQNGKAQNGKARSRRGTEKNN